MRRGMILLVLALCLAGACRSAGERDEVQALARRLAALEARLEAPEPTVSAGNADVQSLERRVAALERQVQALREELAGGAGFDAAEPGAPRLEGRRQQRMQLRELTAQYRDRLAAIRRDEPDPDKRQQAVREALEWYRTQRRQLLAEPPAPPS